MIFGDSELPREFANLLLFDALIVVVAWLYSAYVADQLLCSNI